MPIVKYATSTQSCYTTVNIFTTLNKSINVLGIPVDCFRMSPSLCNKKQECPLPPHNDSETLANDFGDIFCRKIDLLREEIDSIHMVPPQIKISFLYERQQRVVVGQSCSKDYQMKYGVPEVPILFLLYTSRLFKLMEKHLSDMQGYADDTQLYLSFRPSSSEEMDRALSALCAAIAEVRAWLISHKLKFNDTKTEFIIIGTRQQLAKVEIPSVKVGTADIAALTSIRNLGAWFDDKMSMNDHINKTCSKAFRGLYNIRQIRKFLSTDTTKILVHAFVTSHLDYCNSLLLGLPAYQQERIQKVVNAAARVICFIPKYDHITPSLIKLHWLPVKQRIEFKIIIALLVFKAVNGLSPVYLTNLLQIQPTRRYKLRSDDKKLLFIPRSKSKSKSGDRAFAIAGPRIWNYLPLDIRLSANLETFRKNQTYTFLKGLTIDS